MNANMHLRGTQAQNHCCRKKKLDISACFMVQKGLRLDRWVGMALIVVVCDQDPLIRLARLAVA